MKAIRVLPCLCVLLFVSTSGLKAQIPVTWSEPEELGDEESALEMYFLPDGRLYTIEARQFFNLSVRVSLYDANRKFVGRKQLKFAKQDKMWAVAGALHQYIKLRDKFYFITDEPMPGKGSITLLAWEFKPETLTLAEEPIVLATSKGKGMFRAGRFMYVFNESHSSLYVIEMPGQEKKEMEQWTIKEFDEELKLVNERTVTLPYEASKFHVTKADFDGKGNLVLACMLFEKGGPLSAIFSADYTYLYAVVPANSSEVKIVSLDLGGKVAHQVRHVLENDQQTVYVYGFYSARSQNSAEGIFECNFSIKGEIVNKKIHPFPEDVLRNLHRIDKLGSKSEVQHLSMKSVIKNADGSRQFIAEQLLVTNVVYTYDYNFMSSDLHYTSNDILLFKIHPDESLNWFSWISKKQHSIDQGSRFLSFRHRYLPDGSIHIVYNDSPLNLSAKAEDAAVKMNNRNFCTVLAHVSPLGAVTKTKLFDTDEIGHRLLINAVDFNEDEIFLLAVSKKTFRKGVAQIKVLN
jgi:hypothetical protein